MGDLAAVAKATRQVDKLTIPLSPGHWAELTIPRPILGSEWRQMLKVLAAMEPPLVDWDSGPSACACGRELVPCPSCGEDSCPEHSDVSECA